MKVDVGCSRYYGHGDDWLCQTPAIAIGKGEYFLTLTIYMLFWSFSIQFSWK